MAQRQFRSDDTSVWLDGYGSGADGVLAISANTTFSAPNSGCSGTINTTGLTLDAASTFADGDLVIIHQTRGTGAGNWELNKIASGAGTTSLVMSYSLISTYTDSGASQAQIVELKQYSSVTVDSGKTWTATHWDGNKGGWLAFFCLGTTTITGAINCEGGLNSSNSGATWEYGPTGAGFSAGMRDTTDHAGGVQGESSLGIGAINTAANNGTGGGAIQGGSVGGGGGYATAGANGGSTTGGTTIGGAGLTTLFFGGGAGGPGQDLTGDFESSSGGGGGIVAIFSSSIVVTGSISINGAAGETNSAGSVNAGSGGAGGSGLFKAKTITLGSNLVTASAGAGGGIGTGLRAGAAGGVGRIHADYATSLSGTTTPTIDSTQDSTLLNQNQGGGSFFQNFI